ncbi:dihydrofolate reductase family protein [Flavivirga spongiicola]|uniref:Dihydrofolate reductase family protein n=1 Tax=Flavivirga spongiicola TaxID=421621 RepID=A0ABU7XS50_9FLAO|nr:dihydrofolate reductase family protein [Flavivirga sp. MEBiC05379]MDO5977744.1 dihydrofolate reductase family protein [Flavivirga sp. MEBiC05379]
MTYKNIVFIGKSLDGFIAGKNGELDWLDMIPNPEQNGMGYYDLMEEIDAIVMGKTTFESVLSFDIDWPYKKHVFVLSYSLSKIPETLKEKVTLLKGNEKNILNLIHNKGFNNLYIDGGKTVQNFLKADLIDELRISTIPIVLGDGIPLFDILPKSLVFDHVKTEVFLDQIVQSHYQRKK